MATTPEYIDVNITCSSCGNLNRAMRRACNRCGHTGFEGTKRIPIKAGQPINLGGYKNVSMPDEEPELAAAVKDRGMTMLDS